MITTVGVVSDHPMSPDSFTPGQPLLSWEYDSSPVVRGVQWVSPHHAVVEVELADPPPMPRGLG